MEQGLEAGGFDFIIGTNVLHAVSDLRSTLRHIHELLVPGGSLVFMDVGSPELWTEVLFGLTSGWWRFTDRDLRPHQPLLERSQWEFVLRETGFGEIASLPGMLGPEGEGQIGLLARKPWYDSASAASPAAETLLQIPAEKSGLIFADASGVGEGLASQLRGAGVRWRVARRGDHVAQDGSDTFTLRAEVLNDWKQLLHECAKDTPPERFVYLWILAEPRTAATGG